MSDTPKPMTDERLQQIQQRADAATQGPWRNTWPDIDRSKKDIEDVIISTSILPPDEEHVIVGMLWYDFWHTVVTNDNAEFIAHSRADVPALVAEVRRQRAEIARLRKALEPFAKGDLLIGNNLYNAIDAAAKALNKTTIN